MSITRIVPPIDYLHTASRSSLQSFELARLNHAANLRREIAALIDQWIQETSEATLARWMLDRRVLVEDNLIVRAHKTLAREASAAGSSSAGASEGRFRPCARA